MAEPARPDRVIRTLLALLWLPLVGAGCVANSPPSVDTTGSWAGTWQSTEGLGNGTATFLLMQSDGGGLTGSMTFQGHPCFTMGRLGGRVSGNHVSASVTIECNVLDLEATASGGTLQGTYSAVTLTGCEADTGSISATLGAVSGGSDGGTDSGTD